MAFFRKRKKKEPRILEGIDTQWMEQLPGEEYVDQIPGFAVGMTMRIGTRGNQQDAVAARWINESTLVVTVCDGMGGMNGGEIASKSAISSIMEEIERLTEDAVSPNMLLDLIRRVNENIHAMGDENGDPLLCGTTMTLAIVHHNLILWMSVGDSRIYYFSEKGLMRLTKDHNRAFMTELYGEKDNPGDVTIRPDALVSFLGSPSLRLIDYNTVPWRVNDGDALMLCSDGLTKLVDEQSIAETLLEDEDDLDALANKLADEAELYASDKQDNTTILILRYKE